MLKRLWRDLVRWYGKGQAGSMAIGMGILSGVIGVAVTIIVLATAVPVIWPMVTSASGNITAMAGTDAGTTTIKAFWPIVLLVCGLGIAVGLIVYALKRFGVLGGGGS